MTKEIPYIGYDPGGKGANAAAILWVGSDRYRYALNRDVGSVDSLITWITDQISGFEPRGVGIDALLSWESGRGGRRGQDEWLSSQMAAVKKSLASQQGQKFQKDYYTAPSVQSANSLRGSMLVQGLAAASRMRDRWPDIGITETHPKALHYVMSRMTYPNPWKADACRWLAEELGKADGSPIATSDEWDALASAWAAYKGFSGQWSIDLMEMARAPILPAGEVHYWWPCDLYLTSDRT